MEPDAAREMRDTGKRAIVGVLAGSAWLGWALGPTQAVGLLGLVALLCAAVLLLACSLYCIWKGAKLLRGTPKPRRPLNRTFLIALALEALGVGGVILATQKLNRPDALANWIGIIVGLHFFGVAKAFHAAVYYATATAITLWCVLCWILFRGSLTVASGIGIGAILWATASFNLFRAFRNKVA